MHTVRLALPFNGTRNQPTWREANSLPYSSLAIIFPPQERYLVQSSAARRIKNYIFAIDNHVTM